MSKYFNGSLFLITILIFVNIVPSESDDTDENSVVEDRTTGALDFIVQTCTNYCNCQNLTTGLVVDNNWRGVYYNLCYDPKKCDKIPTVSEYQNLFGLTVSPSKTSLTLKYVPTAPGPRIYLTTGPGTDSYQMVYLLNREISFDVDLSTVGCGLNAAFFFVGMDADGGKAKFESNSLTTLLATHTCKAANNCDSTGCGFMPYPLGNKNFYGRGSSYSVDTTKPFTVTTRFVTVDGKDTGNLKEIQRIYKQNGKTIPNPTVAGNFNSISDAFCSYTGQNNLGGISASMTQGLKNGMVLTMGLWGDLKNPNFMGCGWTNHRMVLAPFTPI
uniref:cellulose 1,4-beta-cellobiosidase (non-reducing end) n=1 Tax=Daphnia galeata TaxID=27404 RepID=A0A8J2WII6_9CRUS|nr:unnamed protein product [Daphnia galeata]